MIDAFVVAMLHPFSYIPFMEYDMLEQDINTEPPAQAPGPGLPPGKQTAFPASADLYERLTAVYQQVQDEMNIPARSNKLEVQPGPDRNSAPNVVPTGSGP